MLKVQLFLHHNQPIQTNPSSIFLETRVLSTELMHREQHQVVTLLNELADVTILLRIKKSNHPLKKL